MIQCLPRGAALAVALSCSAFALHSPVAAQSKARAQRHVVRDVRLGLTEDSPTVALVLADGQIEAVLPEGATLPAGARVVEGRGCVALPAFVDAYTRTGCETPEPQVDQDVPVDVGSDVRIDMREANRKGIQPAFRAADALSISADDGKAWRAQGFGVLLASPSGELLSGTSCLATTREAAARDVVVTSGVFAHAAFSASGPGYPSTLMGYMAQLRQFFLDADRHAELLRRERRGRPGPRPPYDRDLAAALSILEGEQRVVCEAESHRDIERWVKLADELGFDIAIGGGREAWRVADLLAARDIPVILTLDWSDEVDDPHAKKGKEKGKESESAAEEQPESGRRSRRRGRPEGSGAEQDPVPDTEADEDAGAEDEAADDEGADAEPEESWKYVEPLAVREERRRLWEEERDGAIRLHEAGVRFAFGTGKRKPKVLLGKVRTLVEEGLPADVARRALTSRACDVLGVRDRLGAIVAGADATFALWTADPLADDAQLAWLFVDGVVHEFEVKESSPDASEGPAEGVDVTGAWIFEFDSPDDEGTGEAEVDLRMSEDGAVEGQVMVESPLDGSELSTSIEGRVSGRQLKLSASFTVGDFDIELKLEVEVDGDSVSGEVTFVTPWGDQDSKLTGARQPGRRGLGSEVK